MKWFGVSFAVLAATALGAPAWAQGGSSGSAGAGGTVTAGANQNPRNNQILPSNDFDRSPGWSIDVSPNSDLQRSSVGPGLAIDISPRNPGGASGRLVSDSDGLGVGFAIFREAADRRAVRLVGDEVWMRMYVGDSGGFAGDRDRVSDSGDGLGSYGQGGSSGKTGNRCDRDWSKDYRQSDDRSGDSYQHSAKTNRTEIRVNDKKVEIND